MDYEGDTDETNRNTDDSQSENNDFVRNLDKEQEYKNMMNAHIIILRLLK